MREVLGYGTSERLINFLIILLIFILVIANFSDLATLAIAIALFMQRNYKLCILFSSMVAGIFFLLYFKKGKVITLTTERNILLKYSKNNENLNLNIRTLNTFLLMRINNKIVIYSILNMVERPKFPLLEEKNGAYLTQKVMNFINFFSRLQDALSRIQELEIPCTYSLFARPVTNAKELKGRALRELKNLENHIAISKKEDLTSQLPPEDKELTEAIRLKTGLSKGFVETSLFIVLQNICEEQTLSRQLIEMDKKLKVVRSVFEAMLPGIKLEELKGKELLLAWKELFFRVPRKKLLNLTLPEASLLFPLPPSSSGIKIMEEDVFPLPTPKKPVNSISIGYSLYKGRGHFPIYLSIHDLLARCLITGCTGFGKSTLAKNIINNLFNELKIKVIVLDQSGEYRSVIMKNLGFIFVVNDEEVPLTLNILNFKGNNLNEHINWVHSFLSEELKLSEPTSEFLRILLEKLYRENKHEVSFRKLLNLLLEYEPEDSASVQIKNALIRRLHLLVKGELGEVLNTEREIDLFNYLDEYGLVSFDFSKLVNRNSKQVIAAIILKKVFEHYYKPEEISNNFKLLVVMDEAQVIVPENGNESSAVLKAVDYLRKVGVGMLFISPSPTILSSYVIRNTSTKICFRTVDNKDKAIMANNMGLDETQKEIFPKLGKFEAVLFSPTYNEPFLIKTIGNKNWEPVSNLELRKYLNLLKNKGKHGFRQAVKKEILQIIQRYKYFTLKELRDIIGLPLNIITQLIETDSAVKIWKVCVDGSTMEVATLLNKGKLLKQMVTDYLFDFCFENAVPIELKGNGLLIDGKVEVEFIAPTSLNASLSESNLKEIIDDGTRIKILVLLRDLSITQPPYKENLLKIPFKTNNSVLFFASQRKEILEFLEQALKL